MDRQSGSRASSEIADFTEALAFVGEVRGGISYERLCRGGIRHAEALIEIMLDNERAHAFMLGRGVPRSYVMQHAPGIFSKLHFNKGVDCYLTLLLPQGTDEATVHRRWKDLMRLYHPDQTELPKNYATECAKHINEVYAFLKDPDKRSRCGPGRQEPKGQPVAAVRPTALKKKPHIIRPLGDQVFRQRLARLILPAIIVAGLAAVAFMVAQNWDRDPARYNWSAQVDALRTAPGKDVKTSDPQTSAPPAPNASLRHTYERPAANVFKGPSLSREEPVTPPGGSRPEEQTRVEPVRAGEVSAVIAAGAVVAADPVQMFVERIIRAYQAGDVEAYIACYSAAAVERGTLRYADIKQAYSRHFSRGRFTFSMRDLQVERTETTYLLTAWYTVTQITGTDAGSSWKGPVRMILVSEKGELKILRNDFDLL